MYSIKKLLVSLSIFLALMNQSFAASSSGDAKARVLAALSISQNTALNFGSFSASSSAGTISQAGIATGGVTAVSTGETRAAGVFNVSGDSTDTTPYTFTLPSTATLSSGANQMTATLSESGTHNSGDLVRSLTSGSDTVTINGVLAVAANQAAGYYAGTYTVIANY